MERPNPNSQAPQLSASAEKLTRTLRMLLNLSQSEARLLALIVLHPGMSKRLLRQLIGTKTPPSYQNLRSELKFVEVTLHKLRKKLEPHDITVDTVHRVGYRLTPANLDRLQALLAAQQSWTFVRQPVEPPSDLKLSVA